MIHELRAMDRLAGDVRRELIDSIVEFRRDRNSPYSEVAHFVSLSVSQRLDYQGMLWHLLDDELCFLFSDLRKAD